MKRTMTITVNAPKELSDLRVARLLKFLFDCGQQLCEDTLDDDGYEGPTKNEEEATSLTAFTAKPSPPPRLVAFVSGGVLTDVYSTLKNLEVTVVDHDDAEQDEAVADANQAVIERLNQDFPFNNF